jgi:hypothetical protein
MEVLMEAMDLEEEELLLEYPCRPSTTKKFKQIRNSLTKLLGGSKWCAYFKW